MKKQYLNCDSDIVEDIELQECRVISEALRYTNSQNILGCLTIVEFNSIKNKSKITNFKLLLLNYNY